MSAGSVTRALLVMAKQPVAGSTKTRLVPRLRPQDAADLYECFLLDALDLARSVEDVRPFVAVSPPEATEYFARIAPDLDQLPQLGSSLGARLDHVLTSCLNAGFDQVVAINSDSPTLPRGYVVDAFDRLGGDRIDVVIGPSADGGYYLIGWKDSHPELVRDVVMSTPHVLRDTLEIAEQSGVTIALLEPWYDVDEPEDLDRLVAEIGGVTETAGHTRRFLHATTRRGA